jgi:hypothetical protein
MVKPCQSIEPSPFSDYAISLNGASRRWPGILVKALSEGFESSVLGDAVGLVLSCLFAGGAGLGTGAGPVDVEALSEGFESSVLGDAVGLVLSCLFAGGAGLGTGAGPVDDEEVEAVGGDWLVLPPFFGLAPKILVCPWAFAAFKRCRLFCLEPGISPCLRVLAVCAFPGSFVARSMVQQTLF